MNIVILTNILTPYRKVFFDEVYKNLSKRKISFTVLVMTDTEPQRVWNYCEFKTDYTKLLNYKNLNIGNYFITLNNDINQKLNELNPDIVIAAGSYISPSVWQAIKLKKKLGYKLLFWSESHLNEKRNLSSIKLKIREFIREYIYKKFDGFLYAGSKSLELINKYEKENSEHYFTPNLINTNKFSNSFNNRINIEEINSIKNKYSVDEERFIFFCPARLDSVKGLDKFIELYKKSKGKDIATVIIAGDGPQKQILNELINKYNLDIRLVGNKNEEEIIELYTVADCFLLPSISDPNPLSCIEALWSGLPLLVSEHVGNYPEVISESNNGYVFSYEDEQESINKIDNLIYSSLEWRENAKNISREIAKEIYDTEESVEKLICELVNNI